MTETLVDGDLLDRGEDGLLRCFWGGSTEEYRAYHDTEWGRPTRDDTRLFEKICLEGFQSGLSWLTILRKRDNFRAAFAGFDVEAVASFGDADVEAAAAGRRYRPPSRKDRVDDQQRTTVRGAP